MGVSTKPPSYADPLIADDAISGGEGSCLMLTQREVMAYIIRIDSLRTGELDDLSLCQMTPRKGAGRREVWDSSAGINGRDPSDLKMDGRAFQVK